MKKINQLLVAGGMLVASSSAQALLIDFQNLATNSELGESAWTVLNTGTNIDISAGPDQGSFAYLDGFYRTPAGLGVCSTGLVMGASSDVATGSQSNICGQSSDDNVNVTPGNVGEELVFTFNGNNSLNTIWVNNNHDSGSLDGKTINVTVGGVTKELLFDDVSHKTGDDFGYLFTLDDVQLGFGTQFGAGDELVLSFGGSSASQFYVSAIDVPEPAIVALLGLGLAGIGFARRTKK